MAEEVAWQESVLWSQGRWVRHTACCSCDVSWSVHADDAVEGVEGCDGLFGLGLGLDGLFALLLQDVEDVVVLGQVYLLDGCGRLAVG